VTPRQLPAVLAIDGGNSKTDVTLVAADGAVLASVRGAGVPGMLAEHETMRVLGSAALAAARQAGLADDGHGLAGHRVARHVSACVANADLPEEERQLAGALRAQGWGETVHVANDTFAVLRAGLDDAGVAGGQNWGVAVTCGAGINCVGVAPDGRTWRFLALGELTGDWGGGDALAAAAIWWAMRAEDGRGPRTALRDAVTAHFGVATMHDVAVGLHTGRIPPAARSGLVPVLFEAAGNGDAVARDIVGRLAGEVCLMVTTTIRRLGLGRHAVPVVLGGGVLAARDPLLTGQITQRLAAEVPHARPRITDVPPIAGAALLGLDHLGATPDAKQRLRSAFAAAQNRSGGDGTAPGHPKSAGRAGDPGHAGRARGSGRSDPGRTGERQDDRPPLPRGNLTWRG
jgi:N-acetylglucosamine kinase-like BadF-type ATPase